MRYRSFKLNKCPYCREKTTGEMKKCKNCGMPLTNICINPDCAKELDGNARFCMACGASSSYNYLNFLPEWIIEKDEYEGE